MKTNAPKKITLLIAAILGLVAVVGYSVTCCAAISFIAPYAFWILFAGFALLLIAALVKGL